MHTKWQDLKTAMILALRLKYERMNQIQCSYLFFYFFLTLNKP